MHRVKINHIYEGDVRGVISSFPNESINLIVTSPSYWGLRDYGASAVSDWGDWKGQLGLEPHPQQYIDHLVLVCRELKRVLRKDGCFYLNMGDTYFGGKGKSSFELPHEVDARRVRGKTIQRSYHTPILNKSKNLGRPQDLVKQDGRWLQPKQLLLMPSRVAVALQEDGWILRNDIVWHKPNHMPSSVKDRLTNAWEHVFHFVKSKRYWYDLDAIRKPSHTTRWGKNPKYEQQQSGLETQGYNPRGKNPGDVWRIPTRPFRGAHFAVFPEALVEPLVKSSCPQWVCKQCGKPRTRLVETTKENTWRKTPKAKGADGSSSDDVKRKRGLQYHQRWMTQHETIGWSDCGCGSGWRGGVVLDPFAGSGTTCLVARKLLREYVGVEINPEYVAMARKRLAKIPARLEAWTQ